uniref:Regulatory protein E2 n=1 Tax=Human papillomavirus 67 TaxID=37120 RepID=F8S5Y1_HPV67|nr:early protein E2 [human papillomavirus 67]CAD1807513.1 early protein E2 [human papillomavirus 67]CAD1807564.1 early protein E2 [human papillomavirus 67]CAD1807714.1 early protein E2 [human papillomavirus 67]CAD1807826.1 early protein E2 [human papillomavirus 67]
MEEISTRLNAVQEKILDVYEANKKDLCTQIEHWRLRRIECALYYKAKEMGLARIGHQVVPPMSVTKAKACQIIELQMALQTLNETQYSNDEWTLQSTSLELWLCEPKKCLKKKGETVTVQYDNNKENTMEYTSWNEIYIVKDSVWTVVVGKVDYMGLYYIYETEKTYYVQFETDAKKYSKQNIWEVHVGAQVIVCPTSMFSNEISTTEVAARIPHATETYTPATTACTKEEHKQAPAKRRRPDVPDFCNNSQHPTKLLCRQRSVDCTSVGLVPGPQCTNKGRSVCAPNTAPIVHLKGDPNSLKCLRYRLKCNTDLYCHMSSTWHWTSGKHTKTKEGIVTVTYASETQRQQFLNSVRIPPTVQIVCGIMSL